MLPRSRGDKDTPPPKQPEGTALVQALSQVTSQLSSLTVKPEVVQQLTTAMGEITKAAELKSAPPKSKAVRLAEAARALEETTKAYD
eukprot:7996764-Pyramimonas_sp.AAC.1